jgi:GNAT superfamily N-acetyltransferase
MPALASRMVELRLYRPSDLKTIYDICLATGDNGRDAAHLYCDPKLVGHVYAGAYAVLSPETAILAEDGEGVGGYIIGPADTYAFEKRCEAEWWPKLRMQYIDPTGAPESWSLDNQMQHHIHRPDRTPRRINEIYPAHLHINLLPRLQGQGIGRILIDRWLETVWAMGARGACLGVSSRNERAVRFYRAYGFHEVERFGAPADGILFGIAITPHPEPVEA